MSKTVAEPRKLLIGSPIKQKSNILREFLLGLEEADKGDNQIVYFFIDDNNDEESSELLHEFAKRNETILKSGVELCKIQTDYNHHGWTPDTLKKVTEYKNTIIQHCIDNNFDFLLLIDSDIVIDRRSILQLLSDNVDIVSNVFWNQWRKNGSMTAQCFWIPDIYLQESAWNTPRPFAESHKIRLDMYEQLKKPGLYEVDGTGAFTLVSRRALEAGVNFTEIPNLKILGEDRPFCIRAGVLGFTLYMDTHYPAYHCSKEIYLDRVDEFKRDGWKFDMCQTFEEENTKKKPLPKVRRFIVRVAKRIVRDFSD